MIDRTIVLNTASSATAALNTASSPSVIGVTVANLAFTTAPVLELQGSDDGTNWARIGNTFTPTAGTTFFNNGNAPFQFLRVFVTTAGTGATYSYIAVKVGG
jgi:hypothetical protein